jgi:hypothetical protein
MSKRHVFLSYCREDYEEAQRLRENLEDNGIPVWVDQNIVPGEHWKKALNIAIDDSDAFLLCLSKQAVGRRKSWIYRETRYAIASRYAFDKYREYKPDEIYIIPVRFSECDIPDLQIDHFNTLNDLEWVDLFPIEQRTPQLRRLVETLKTALQLPTKSSRKDEVEIPFDRNLDDFSQEEREQFLDAVKDSLKTDDITITNTSTGEVTLTLELSPARAEALRLAVSAGEFEKFGVMERRSQVALEAFHGVSNPITSIFGQVKTWLPPYRTHSEFNVLNLSQPLRLLRFFRDLTVPAQAREPPPWVKTLYPEFVWSFFWRPSTFFQEPDPYGSFTSFNRERWIFINGLAANKEIVRINSSFLSHLFHRPLTVLQTSTESLPLDLYESVMAKGTFGSSAKSTVINEPSLKATITILSAITQIDIDRVVVLAHSTGTLVLANAIQAIQMAIAQKTKLADASLSQKNNLLAAKKIVNKIAVGARTEHEQALRDQLVHELCHYYQCIEKEKTDQLKKLEIYTFANCAEKMKYVTDGRHYPRFEHFANERDIIARLGILSPLLNDADGAFVNLDGPIYIRKGALGDLLNEHYLYEIHKYLASGMSADANPYRLQSKRSSNARQIPRLYQYFKGGKPVTFA